MTAASMSVATTSRAWRILVVEDEVLISMVLEDMLGILGHVVIGMPSTFAEADIAIAAGGFDLVIADVNLGAQPIYPLADRVVAAGVPLILATGSHRDSLPARFADVPVLAKPYALPAIASAVGKIF